uniref:Uncharacterized protein n=1 Tax=Octactis speculum TaxID=3111310 RepID=A0A7S2HD44_9STRA|mmetsp:Transcript_63731/g.87595  ORF Transcript_63731/g.87595 Transcript_63731/m.87595 type:complete len:122 (+) Transcript_63731:2-367(+)
MGFIRWWHKFVNRYVEPLVTGTPHTDHATHAALFSSGPPAPERVCPCFGRRGASINKNESLEEILYSDSSLDNTISMPEHRDDGILDMAYRRKLEDHEGLTPMEGNQPTEETRSLYEYVQK